MRTRMRGYLAREHALVMAENLPLHREHCEEEFPASGQNTPGSDIDERGVAQLMSRIVISET